jgi:hypothetical protein
MRLESLAITQDSHAAPCWSLTAPEAEYDIEPYGLHEERWRHPPASTEAAANILATR